MEGGQVQLAGGGQVSQLTGGFRSSRQGGSGPAGGGGGVSGPARGGSGPAGGGGVSILRPLAGGMPLAFTQEDFLVQRFISSRNFCFYVNFRIQI